MVKSYPLSFLGAIELARKTLYFQKQTVRIFRTVLIRNTFSFYIYVHRFFHPLLERISNEHGVVYLFPELHTRKSPNFVMTFYKESCVVSGDNTIDTQHN